MTMFGSQWLDNPSRGYEIEQSIRFNAAEPAYLQRTPGSGSVGNDHTWTFSWWMKRGGDVGSSGAQEGIMGAGDGSDDDGALGDAVRFDAIGFNGDDLQFFTFNGVAASGLEFYTDAKFRDPTAWMHFIVRYDDTQSTEALRVRIYINGVQVTSFSTANYPDQNNGSNFNGALLQRIGANTVDPSRGIDGYLAETVMIDGTSLGPTSFGEYNAAGVWIPIDVSGLTYGTNGFRLKGQDSSALGDDTSGEGNDFASAGQDANDQMLDSPTINFSTMSPIDVAGGATEFLNGNLDLDQDNFGRTRGTIAFDVQDSDGFYFEVKKTSGNASASYRMAGIVATTSDFGTANVGSINPSVTYYMEGGEVNQDGSLILGSLTTFTLNDVLGVAVRNGKVYFAKNDTYVNSGDPEAESGHVAAITASSLLYTAIVGETNNQTGVTSTVNFGATAFAHTPPAGYKKINTDNLPASTIVDGSANFHTQIYTGNATSGLSITNAANAGDFQPDLLWLAPRSNGDNHVMVDSVRGTTSRLKTNSEDAQDTDSTALFTFESDGFDLDTTDANFNGDGRTYVAWQWYAPTSFSGSTGTQILASSGKKNAAAGFSIVSWTHRTSANYAINHGLSTLPEMLIIKSRVSGTNWEVWHHNYTDTSKRTILNGDGALIAGYFADAADTSAPFANAANGESPVTATLFALQTGDQSGADAMIGYFFHSVPGYSKISSFEGNGGANGSYVQLGFRPAFVMIKSIDSTSDFQIFDSKRSGFNPDNDLLSANNTTTEATTVFIDFLANGFKGRVATDPNVAETYIYMAFAENPFGGDGVAPATAR